MSTGSMFLVALLGATVAATVTAAVKYTLRTGRQITFEEFLNQVGKTADEYMLKEAKEKKIQFIGGDCEISRFPETMDTVSVKIKIYSRDAYGNWQTSTLENKMSVSDFANDTETQSSLNKLKTESLKMKVTVPNKEEKL